MLLGSETHLTRIRQRPLHRTNSTRGFSLTRSSGSALRALWIGSGSDKDKESLRRILLSPFLDPRRGDCTNECEGTFPNESRVCLASARCCRLHLCATRKTASLRSLSNWKSAQNTHTVVHTTGWAICQACRVLRTVSLYSYGLYKWLSWYLTTSNFLQYTYVQLGPNLAIHFALLESAHCYLEVPYITVHVNVLCIGLCTS
jgi:hypothetical protein